MKTGMSLSFCVADMIEGKVLLSEVDRIVCGTKAMSDDAWERVIEDYSRVYWRKNPAKARELVRKMRSLGMLDQPRTRGEAPPDLSHGHWVESGDPVPTWYDGADIWRQ